LTGGGVDSLPAIPSSEVGCEGLDTVFKGRLGLVGSLLSLRTGSELGFQIGDVALL
jgi:hypothetical protein